MENQIYIKTDDLYEVVQAIPGSVDGDSVAITIVRRSDGYYWNFTDEDFTSTADTGAMTFSVGTFWESEFTPPTDDDYLVTITHAVLALTYTQVLRAIGDADSFTFRTNSEVSICNYALTKLGANTIISLTDESEQARKCAMIYARVRDRLLRCHPWNFAMKRETLVQLDETPDYGYTYVYALPSDCLRYWSNSVDAEVKIEGNKLLTDESTIAIRYISKVTDPGEYSASFVEAFAEALAAELAFPITASRTVMADKKVDAKDALARAKSEDGQEGTPDEPICDEWLNARG